MPGAAGSMVQTHARRAGRRGGPRMAPVAHEPAPMYWYLLFGLSSVPLYLSDGGFSARNRFERAADRCARDGRGRLPWFGGAR